MKFQKILILLYLLIQSTLAICINAITNLNLLYFISTLATVTFFLITHLKDPGYLVVEEGDLRVGDDGEGDGEGEEGKIGENRDRDRDREGEDGEDVVSGREIVVFGPNNEIIKCQNPIDFNTKFHSLSSSPNKLPPARSTRYCGICTINQPIRTKHCHECQKCISTYDHHCPWLNNCIGQKNRQYFLLFLLAQTCQAFIAAVQVCSVAVNRIAVVEAEWILGVGLIVFLSAMLGLTGFHGYLMVVNVTTCKNLGILGELVKWDSIPYLAKCDRSKGSPFSKGFARNIRQYWSWSFQKTRKIWQFQT